MAMHSSSFATKTLWTRYELTPPQGEEITWAKTWAIRLADQEQDAVLRSFSLPAPGVTDLSVWPYRQNDTSAVAAVVKKIVAIFSLHPNLIYGDDGMFSQISLRVLAPLDVSINRSFSLHKFYTLGNFLPEKKRSVWAKIGLVIGIIIDIIGIIAVDVGIVSLLPPDGNLFDFWMWLPFVWKFVVVGIFLLVVVILKSLMYPNRSDVSSYLYTLIVVFLPILAFYVFIWIDNRQTIEQCLSLKKMKWSAVLYVLVVSLIAAIAGFFAINRYVSIISPYIYIPLLIIIFLFGILLGEYSAAFSKNEMATWVKSHPRWAEILNEFARNKG